MHWRIILEIVGVIGGITTAVALFLGPMFYLGSKIDSKIDGLRAEMRLDMDEFRKETKDFHARLQRQDSEFKADLLLLEEKFRRME